MHFMHHNHVDDDVRWRMQDARVGDTITVRGQRASQEPLPGYAEAKPQVFCGLFPVNADDYQGLREALERLQLNDAALSFEPEVRVYLYEE
jgi:translation elongation factor EF-4